MLYTRFAFERSTWWCLNGTDILGLIKFIRCCINTSFGRRWCMMFISFVANIFNAKKLNLDHNQTDCILLWMYLTNLGLIYLWNLFLVNTLKRIKIVFLLWQIDLLIHFIACNEMDDAKHATDLFFKEVGSSLWI